MSGHRGRAPVAVRSAETVVRVDSTALRRARLAAGLSRTALAQRVHLRPGQVRWWEQRVCWVAVYRVRWLAEALGLVDLFDLVADGTPISLGILVAREGSLPTRVASRLGISLARWHDILHGVQLPDADQLRLLNQLLGTAGDQILAALHTQPETRPAAVELTEDIASWLTGQPGGGSMTDVLLHILQLGGPQPGK